MVSGHHTVPHGTTVPELSIWYHTVLQYLGTTVSGYRRTWVPPSTMECHTVPMGTWYHSNIGCHGAEVSHCTTVSGYHGTWLPQYFWVPQYHWVPCYLGTRYHCVPWHHWVSCYQCTMVPQYHSWAYGLGSRLGSLFVFPSLSSGVSRL